MATQKMTLKQAVDLCKTVFGTSNGLQMVARGMEYEWHGGSTNAKIRLAPCDRGVIEIRTKGAPGVLEVVYDLATLQPNDIASDVHQAERDGQRLREWVWDNGADWCCKQIKKIWEAKGK